MKAYVPSNLQFEVSERHIGKYYYLISKLYLTRVLNKTIEIDDYIPLKSEFLVKVLGCYYRKYLNDLIQNGIIETDNFYIKGEKARGYRLTEKYRYQKFRKVEITDRELIKRVTKRKMEYKNKMTENENINYIYECMNEIILDYDNAYNWIEQNVTEIDKYVSYNISLDLINEANYFFIVDDTAGRIHNNFTNLPKDLRPFLSYNKQPLIEVDIANSQPFFFNVLIERYMRDREYDNINLSYVYNKGIDVSYLREDDIKLYRELTCQGRFYEYLRDQFDAYERYESRDDFKRTVFAKIFYSQENENYIYEERRKFRKLFPRVAEIIKYYKKDDYKNLAIQLQRVEAEIIIHKIIPKLAEENIWAITIHDSILTTKKEAERVKQIMLNTIQDQLNLQPKIRIKGGE